VQYSLSGVEARWKASDGSQTSSVTLPHVDFTVARAFTAHSTSHDAFWKVLKQPGELTLSTSLNLDHMLRPAVQPGATIDYELPPEEVTIELSSGMPMTLKLGGQGVETKSVQGRFVASLSHKGAARVPLEIVLTTGAWNADLALSWHTAEDKRPRALPLVRLQLPWTPAESASIKPVMRPSAADAPELAGGNWSRGKAVFFSEQAACSKCHAFQGQGAKIGPDLSNLPKRDYASVLRDITEPSFAINPDFISHVVALSDGRILTGTIRSDGDQLLIADTNGKVTPVPASEIDELRPTAQSIMPQGIPKQLGEARLRDLLVFLLADPPRMTDYGKGDPPKPRTRNEVDDILAGAPKTGDKPKAMKIVLVAGPKDHGPGEHDYPAWQKVWQRLLSMDETCTVETAQQWPSEEQLKSADVLVFYQQGKWTADRARDMDAFLGRGGGAVYIHYAVDGGTDAPGFAQRIGLAWQGGRSKFRHGPLDLGFDPAKDHPIARNFTKLHLHDESYWQLVGDPKKITLLATGPEDNAEQPLFWTMQPGKARVFVSIPGHFSWSFDDPLFRVLLLRGIAWTAGEPVDRFNELVLPGARVE
jgi:putative heme-binding domain-containing protein